MFITISSSSAPSFVTWRASWALISGSVAPIGNPIVLPTLTSEPSKVYRARSTYVGFTMTHFMLYCLASQHSFIMSSFVAVLRTSVLSIICARLCLVSFIFLVVLRCDGLLSGFVSKVYRFSGCWVLPE